MQEFVLARDVQMIIGDSVIPLYLFDAVVNAIHDLRADLDPMGGGEHGYELSRANASLMSQLFSYREQYALSRKQQCSGKHGIVGISLVSCLLDAPEGRQCKDARDRIFAMLALAEDDFGIRPDYTLPLSNLLNDFAKSSLLSGDLSVLNHSCVLPNHDSRLFSFAPSIEDWKGMTLPLNAPKLNFLASPNHLARVGRTLHDSISIEGVRVDETFRN